ncbi:coiled-coil domain-containing protein 137 [Pieris napi]|uniref:coiled-coil domain-containing protein 137 n=1 Tax=Pieris napi TaxID=78633 RepID=UPI001FBA1C3E|nr:coiled-coil domain-containing protein 137 [Pieris napi]
MGRKIPAKKHRGVKDPLVQHARRMQSLKDKINAPPIDPDEQPVPRSLSRLFAFQDNGKVTKKKKKKLSLPSKESIQKGVGINPITQLKKLPGESGRGFSLRINSAIRALHDPIDEEEYPQDLEHEDAKGERMFDQRERRRRKKKGKQNDEEPKLTRTQKFALKKKAKKEKAAAEEEIKEVVYEHVEFGDITHAPPNLTVRPKMRGQDSTSMGAPRPGRKELLLSSMLSGNTKNDLVNAADVARRERARLDVVAAYRELKKQKRLETKTKKK